MTKLLLVWVSFCKQINIADSCEHWLKSTWPGMEADLKGKAVDTLRFTCLGAREWWIMDSTEPRRCYAGKWAFMVEKIISY